MVKPATAPPTEDLPPGVENITDDAKRPDPTSGHSADPDFYRDQFDLIRWRVLGAAGEVITSAVQGFATEAEAEADFDECRKDGRLIDFIEFQGKSGNGFTTTETAGDDEPKKKAAKKT